MKRKGKVSILFIMTIVILCVSLLFPMACKKNTQPVYWRELYKDKEWISSINQYLGLVYREQSDIAAFTGITSEALTPSLYSTYNILGMLASINMEIGNRDKLEDFISSLKNADGAYLNPSSMNSHAADETYQAIKIFNMLGIQPKDRELTANYLLSLKCEDGTFISDPDSEINPYEQNKLVRISEGTYSVVKSLVMLGFSDKIPPETISAIVQEIYASLGDTGIYPSLKDIATWRITVAIELISIIDPSLVTERAKGFISYAFDEIANMPEDVFSFSSRVNRLLDIAHMLQLPEGMQESIFQEIRIILKNKIFTQQNITGGFGPSDTIEPMTSSQVIVLTNRLGVKYPNLDKLLSEINKHWVGDGWTPFLIQNISDTSYIYTYYALEIAKFSGYYNYNKNKVENFLAQYFTNTATNIDNMNLREVYYSVKALKAMNGKLKSGESQHAEEICIKLSQRLLTTAESNVDTQFAYAILVSKEVGFKLPEEVTTRIRQLAGYFKENMNSGKTAFIPSYIYLLWKSSEEQNPIITNNELVEYLSALYDKNSGGYTMPVALNLPTSDAPNLTASHPEIFQTYSAILLLSGIGSVLHDKEKTLNFVMSSKQKFGFSRAPDLYDVKIEATFAAVMILKQLSQ